MKNFTISINNQEGLPVIYSGEPQKMILSIANNTDRDIVISEEIELFLPENLCFSEAENNDSGNGSWIFLKNESGNKFLFTGKAEPDLAKGENCEIYLDNLMIDPEKSVSESVTGIKVKIGADIYDVDLFLGRKPSDHIKIELVPPEIYVASDYKNRFKLRILNTLEKAVRGNFTISFPLGNEISDLADNEKALLIEDSVIQSDCDVNLTKSSTGSWKLEFNEDEYLGKGKMIVLEFSNIISNIKGHSKANIYIDKFEVEEADVSYEKEEYITRGIEKKDLPFKRISDFKVKLSSYKYYHPIDEITAEFDWKINYVHKVKIKFNEEELFERTYQPEMGKEDSVKDQKIKIVLGGKGNIFQIDIYDNKNNLLESLQKKDLLSPIDKASINGQSISIIKINNLLWMAEDYTGGPENDKTKFVKDEKYPHTKWYSTTGAYDFEPDGWRLPTDKEYNALIKTYWNLKEGPVEPDPYWVHADMLTNPKYYFNAFLNGIYHYDGRLVKKGKSVAYICRHGKTEMYALTIKDYYAMVLSIHTRSVDSLYPSSFFNVRYVKELDYVDKSRLYDFTISASSTKCYYPIDKITVKLKWKMIRASKIRIKLNAEEVYYNDKYQENETIGEAEVTIEIVLGKVCKDYCFEIFAYNKDGLFANSTEKLPLSLIKEANVDGVLLPVIKINDLIWTAKDVNYNQYKYSMWKIGTKEQYNALFDTYRKINSSESSDLYDKLTNPKYYFNVPTDKTAKIWPYGDKRPIIIKGGLCMLDITLDNQKYWLHLSAKDRSCNMIHIDAIDIVGVDKHNLSARFVMNVQTFEERYLK